MNKKGATTYRLLFCAAFVLFYTALVDGHSFLIHPTSDAVQKAQQECRVGKPEGPAFANLDYMQCHGPCGQLGKIKNNAEFFSTSHGLTKLARGQTMYMKWTKNNHKSGFVRFALVPKNHRMDKNAHSKFAFHFSCWEAGEIHCDQHDDCGTDQKGLRYQTRVEIPRVFPDGDYILGWSWYGGTQYFQGSEKAEFGDYWSCANIKIHGSINDGQWVDDKWAAESFTPVFRPGMNDQSQTKCFSAVDRLGLCTREPCYHEQGRIDGRMMVPYEFNGRSPCPIRSDEIVAAAKNDQPVSYNEGGCMSPGSHQQGSDPSSSSEGHHSPDVDDVNFKKVKILRFELFDLRSGSLVDYDFNGEINVSNFKSALTVQVVMNNPRNTRKVEFYIDGDLVKTEGKPPYYISGDVGSNPSKWRSAPFNRRIQLTAKAYGKDGSYDEITKFPSLKAS